MSKTAKYKVGELVVFNFLKDKDCEKHQITACQLWENGFNYQVKGKWWPESSIKLPTVYPGDIDYQIWKLNTQLSQHGKPYCFEVSWQGDKCDLYLSTPENVKSGLWGNYLMSGITDILKYLETYQYNVENGLT